MEFNKDTLKQARRHPTPATHRAVLSALDVLDKQPANNSLTLPRWAVAATAAVTVVALVATVPPLRHRAANLAQDALGGAIPQTDRVNPAAGAETPEPTTGVLTVSTTLFGKLDVSPYSKLPAIAQTIGVSQSIGKITATIQEAALTDDKLYIALLLDNAPENRTSLGGAAVTIDRRTAVIDSAVARNSSEYLLCVRLTPSVQTPGETLPVHMTFFLNEGFVQNGNQTEGTLLGNFSMDFDVTMGQTVLHLDGPAGFGATEQPTVSSTTNSDSVFWAYKDSISYQDSYTGRSYLIYGLASEAAIKTTNSQKVNGISVRLEEVALVNDKVILALQFDGLTKDRNLTNTPISVTVSTDGKSYDGSDGGLFEDNRFLPIAPLPTYSLQDGKIYPMHVTITLRQPSGGVKNKDIVLATFEFDFQATARQFPDGKSWLLPSSVS